MQRRKVVLPEPDGPEQADDLAAVHVQVDALEHLVAVEALGDVDGVDEGLVLAGARALGGRAVARVVGVSCSDIRRLLPRPGARSACWRRGAEAAAEALLQEVLADHEDRADDEVPRGGGDERRHDLRSSGCRSASLVEELGDDGDRREQRGVLDHGDRLVAGRRHDDAHRLGEHDAAHRLAPAHAERLRPPRPGPVSTDRMPARAISAM